MAVELNPDAVKFAEQLIRDGKVVRDEHGDWHAQQPTADDSNRYLESHPWSEYAQWHLGVDPDKNPETKSAWEFPYGNGSFTEVVRSGLIAAEERAGQYGHDDIKAAAKKLLEQIDGE